MLVSLYCSYLPHVTVTYVHKAIYVVVTVTR